MTNTAIQPFLDSSKSALVENHSVPSETSFKKASGANNSNYDSESLSCHDLWRIGLYYIYIEMTPIQINSHIDLQKQVSRELGLKGRIRVSKEGVNGVVSGKYEYLQIYAKIISCALEEVERIEGDKKNPRKGFINVTDTNTTGDDDNEGDFPNINLDIKYCKLRVDLPVQTQLFDRLIVKETKNVIGLFDQSIGQGIRVQKQKSSKSEKYRRRRERKRQEQEAKRKIKTENLDPTEPKTQIQIQQSYLSTPSMCLSSNEISVEQDDETGENQDTSSQTLDMRSLYHSVMEEPLKPGKHLVAAEWDDKLDAVASSKRSALLLDVRNVYEMKVGHFAHPSVPTLLTNTRKYSDLPQLLASNEELKKRDQIFMYCTGGVRCERVSMLVNELYPEKEIFQLKGGIQRYLETCERKKGEQKQQLRSDSDSIGKNPGYFVGKNFVFDPRRTDPIHFGETVGRCLVCKTVHDDYDNGHSPSENREARCNKCRMLILICKKCRQRYRCHGETDDVASNCHNKNIDEIEEQKSGSNSTRPLLYCNLDVCIHEGSIPDPELRVTAK